MQTGKWFEPHLRNAVSYTIKLPSGEIKKGWLRYTVSQRNRFQEYIKSKNEGDARNIDILHIALNPTEEKEIFTIEEIESALDLDQIKLLGEFWLEKKMLNPKLTPELDPDCF